MPLTGAGTSRVTFSYRLPGQRVGAAISLGSTAAALVILIVGLVRGPRRASSLNPAGALRYWRVGSRQRQ